MHADHDFPEPEQERAVLRHFNEETYINQWNPDHIHCGLFEAGECPRENERGSGSEGYARALERMIEVIVAPAGIERGHHVVDAGCGVGGTAVYLAKTRGCAVTGVDLNQRHIEMAREKATAEGLDGQIAFERGDCSSNLPLADASVDAVVNIESACHYSDRGRFLREVGRILKPGKRVVASDWLARDSLPAGQYEAHIQPMCEPWALSGLESRSTYGRRLREAGLELLEFEGFGGQEMENLRLIENHWRALRGLEFLAGTKMARLRRKMDKIGVLIAAWRGGYFELGRYCAEKG